LKYDARTWPPSKPLKCNIGILYTCRGDKINCPYCLRLSPSNSGRVEIFKNLLYKCHMDKLSKTLNQNGQIS
jgi:hypothetical protein